MNLTDAKNITTRFAPSPTGNLHLGGARTALFNWLAARATGGKFILRIDDTDKERSKPEYVDDIKRGLEWLGLDWDSEVRQSERTEIYNSHLESAIQRGFAVKNDDGSTRLNLIEEPGLVGTGEPLTFRIQSWFDHVGGNIAISDQDWKYIQTAPLARADGSALYNFASITDDMDLAINLIIRGVDHITNTSLQACIASTVFATAIAPAYAHVGLIHSSAGKKMAKRAGDDEFFLSHYIQAGYSPDAMFNCLLRLGWGPKVDDKSTAVLTREDALALFMSGGNLRSAPAKFDIVKLNSWDRKFKARNK